MYQYPEAKTQRTQQEIQEQLAKAYRAVARKAPMKRNKYVDVKTPNKQVNTELTEKHLALAGIKDMRRIGRSCLR